MLKILRTTAFNSTTFIFSNRDQTTCQNFGVALCHRSTLWVIYYLIYFVGGFPRIETQIRMIRPLESFCQDTQKSHVGQIFTKTKLLCYGLGTFSPHKNYQFL